ENTGLALNIGTLGSTESSTGINNPSNNTFSVAPTVTTGKVTLNCLLPQSTDLSINIYDMAGKIVQSMNRKQQVGSQQIELDLSRLPNAAYLVELSTNGSTQTQKVMVQR
ncbi:MAG TPA: T9SS type A sorting domain-containing protein, partial [Chitinophagales bacterium]|nr:T9SS type A sorting domain-containing protein [Chitinophagales bacterium]